MNDSLRDRILLALDDWRVRQHFKRVERVLRARDVSHLPNALQTARARHLDELHRYATRGVFPRNHERAGYAPCFIDRDGRECAVAHLVMADGGIATAHRIADLSNYAYVPELNFLQLEVWAADSGFTLDELALIQPSYVYDPELRELLPQLVTFAFSVTAMIWTVQLAALAGVITTTVNIARLRHRKPGKFAAALGLLAAIALLFLAVGIANRLLSGTELIARYSSYQPPMIDWEISLARGAFVEAWFWAGGALLVGVLCIALSVARLVMNRRLTRQPMMEPVQKQTSRLEMRV